MTIKTTHAEPREMRGKELLEHKLGSSAGKLSRVLILPLHD